MSDDALDGEIPDMGLISWRVVGRNAVFTKNRNLIASLEKTGRRMNWIQVGGRLQIPQVQNRANKNQEEKKMGKERLSKRALFPRALRREAGMSACRPTLVDIEQAEER